MSTFDTDRLARLRQTMAGYVASGSVPGFTTLVASGDDVQVDT